MNIMVFDVPATSGGALTILNEYYEKAKLDKNNTWYFIVSTPDLDETSNVKILKYPWIKKSWFHRLYFDNFVARKIVKLYEADEILSLQNLIIKGINLKQTLYLHQSLPFVEKKYGIKENLKFWIYQNIIGKMIFKSIKDANEVIVQTNWMKDACIKRVNTNKDKFKVIAPNVELNVDKYYNYENNEYNKLFFYPSSGLSYKNHALVVETCKLLSKDNINDYKIIFTLKGNENKEIKKLYEDIHKYNLPIYFIGQIDRSCVYEYYSKSILIFPSYIETFGLPLLEAKEHKSPILASDCVFSHEILDDYNDVNFFNPYDKYSLYKLMKMILTRQ